MIQYPLRALWPFAPQRRRGPPAKSARAFSFPFNEGRRPNDPDPPPAYTWRTQWPVLIIRFITNSLKLLLISPSGTGDDVSLPGALQGLSGSTGRALSGNAAQDARKRRASR